jgi:hypothetical protein
MMARPVAVGLMALGLTAIAHAQRRSAIGGAGKPKVDIVEDVGCVERRGGSPVTWWLSHAAEPRVTQSATLNTNDLEQVKTIPLGPNEYQLVGVSDFLDVDGLLENPVRRQFTHRETANATGQLRAGYKVVVKGPLVDVDGQKRINLMAVVDLSDACR